MGKGFEENFSDVTKGELSLGGRNLLSDEFSLPKKFTDRIPIEESTTSKLSRSATLLKDAVIDGATERASDHKSLALQGAMGAALGYTLTAMRDAGGRVATAANVASVILGAGVVADVSMRVKETSSAVSDYWASTSKYYESKERIANSLGTAVVDYAAMSAGGAIGVGARNFHTNFSSLANRSPNLEPLPGVMGVLENAANRRYGQVSAGESAGARASSLLSDAASGENTLTIRNPELRAAFENYAKSGALKIDFSREPNAFWDGRKMSYGMPDLALSSKLLAPHEYIQRNSVIPPVTLIAPFVQDQAAKLLERK